MQAQKMMSRKSMNAGHEEHFTSIGINDFKTIVVEDTEMDFQISGDARFESTAGLRSTGFTSDAKRYSTVGNEPFSKRIS
jgi:hypothetical protein